MEQKDLAAAAQVTESYISQLLARKKAPPAPARTGIYRKMGAFLQLPAAELSNLAELQRKEDLRKKVAEPPQPLFAEFRGLILRKCNPASQVEVRRIFERDPFGELERLVTQKLLDAAQGGGDVFHVSVQDLDRIIESWSIDLKTFAMTVALERRTVKRFEFTEQGPSPPLQPGLEQFLNDKSLSAGATPEEIEFLRALPFQGRRPSPLYYYRELQSLRDPLHFEP